MKNYMDIQVKEMNNHTAMDLCSINLSAAGQLAKALSKHVACLVNLIALLVTRFMFHVVHEAMASQNEAERWMGPAVKMSLPSFRYSLVFWSSILGRLQTINVFLAFAICSGCTEYNPHLLKYSCQIECRLLLSKIIYTTLMILIYIRIQMLVSLTSCG